MNGFPFVYQNSNWVFMCKIEFPAQRSFFIGMSDASDDWISYDVSMVHNRTFALCAFGDD